MIARNKGSIFPIIVVLLYVYTAVCFLRTFWVQVQVVYDHALLLYQVNPAP